MSQAIYLLHIPPQQTACRRKLSKGFKDLVFGGRLYFGLPPPALARAFGLAIGCWCIC